MKRRRAAADGTRSDGRRRVDTHRWDIRHKSGLRSRMLRGVVAHAADGKGGLTAVPNIKLEIVLGLVVGREPNPRKVRAKSRTLLGGHGVGVVCAAAGRRRGARARPRLPRQRLPR
jgi:hypothetical protein